MSTEAKTQAQRPDPVESPLSLQEVAELLIKHYALTDGLYDLLVEYQIGTGAVGPDKDNLVPGAMIGVSRLGLVPATKPGPNTINASLVNPAKKPRKKTG
jgi:hypothetical protein